MGRISYGVFLPFYAFSAEGQVKSPFEVVRDVVLECERLGFDSVYLDDHLMWGNKPILECWTVLSALSAVTSKIRLGTMVVCASFRNPALLAKMAATFDVVSNGRLELGLGAGVQEDEHAAYGVSFPKPSVRIERLVEAVIILKKMWTEEKATFMGEHYRVNSAVCEPKPVQKPHPPIIIGGGGEKMMIKVQAQYADRVDWGYLPTLELYEHKLQVLLEQCRILGRDFQEIQKSAWVGGQIFIAGNENELNAKLGQWKPRDMSLDAFKETNLICTPEDCAWKIREYADLGVTHFMLSFGDFPRLDGLKVFAEAVMGEI